MECSSPRLGTRQWRRVAGGLGTTSDTGPGVVMLALWGSQISSRSPGFPWSRLSHSLLFIFTELRSHKYSPQALPRSGDTSTGSCRPHTPASWQPPLMAASAMPWGPVCPAKARAGSEAPRVYRRKAEPSEAGTREYRPSTKVPLPWSHSTAQVHSHWARLTVR